MNIKKIIELQNKGDQLYLLRQGLFYRGYNQAAAYLHKIMGYQVMSKESKACGKRICYVGFPVNAFDKVKLNVREQGVKIEKKTDNSWLITGVSVAFNETEWINQTRILPQSRTKNENFTVLEKKLFREIVEFSLYTNTPLECVRFIAYLQDQLREFSFE